MSGDTWGVQLLRLMAVIAVAFYIGATVTQLLRGNWELAMIAGFGFVAWAMVYILYSIDNGQSD